MNPITITPYELQSLTEGAEALRLIALRLAEANPKETSIALSIRANAASDPDKYFSVTEGFAKKSTVEYMADPLSHDRVKAPTLELALAELTRKTDRDALLRKARLHREHAEQLEAEAALIKPTPAS